MLIDSTSDAVADSASGTSYDGLTSCSRSGRTHKSYDIELLHDASVPRERLPLLLLADLGGLYLMHPFGAERCGSQIYRPGAGRRVVIFGSWGHGHDGDRDVRQRVDDHARIIGRMEIGVARG